MPLDPGAVAERFFRGVYEGNVAVVDELAAEDIVASYPIFAQIFGAPVIRGAVRYRAHAANFAETWADGLVTIHERIVEGDRVVLIWSFRARQIAGGPPGTDSAYSSWGGITRLRVDRTGRIVEEVGEESNPGPMARLNQP